MGRWRRKFTSLGRAGVDLVVSEIDAVLADFAVSSRGVVKASLFFGLAAATGFWAVGMLTYFLVQVLALWLPLWGAAGVVLLLLLMAGAILYLLGRRVLRQLETPAATVRRHVRDHFDWWQDEVLAEERALPRGRGDEGGGA
jgi:cytochrome c biogenesis protein CcdA